MRPFEYPPEPHIRRHGPRGYADYESYRAWLRDEFTFRCVYCLTRETWTVGGFHSDHFIPTSNDNSLGADYGNLLYACATCNRIKLDLRIPDPATHLLSSAISVLPDGTLEARTREAKLLVAGLRLNRPLLCKHRKMWISIIALARKSDPVLWNELLGFPDELPDLSKFRPPSGDAKPEGIEESYFRKRERGELPETY